MSEEHYRRERHPGSEEFGDASLAELLAVWKVTPESSSLRAKTIARMNAPPRFSMYIFAPRFQMATVGLALLIGVVSGAVLPTPYTTVDTVQIVAGLW